MRRKADELLREWRDRADRKPLLVKGVRQCGKTYLLRTYAQDLFESVVYVNLENDRSARADFWAVLTSFDRTCDRGSYGTAYRAWQNLTVH